MTRPTSMLPVHITKPLWMGAGALFVFLVCVVLWVTYAPLTTSIHLSGSLISSRPDYKLQHPYGGQIAWVGIRPHEQVSKGQALVRLNFDAERASLAQTRKQIATLVEANALLQATLAKQSKDMAVQATASIAARLLNTEARANILRVNTLRDTSDALETQISGIEEELIILDERLTLLHLQETKQSALRERALTRDADVIQATNQLLDVSGQQIRRRVDLGVLRHEREQTLIEALRLEAEFDAKLLTRLAQNETTLSRLRSEETRLNAIVETETVYSPIDGHVHSLAFNTALSFAPRGETLVNLAQRLKAPRIRLTVPVASVDQVQVGMSGKLTVNSLPQRTLPPVFVTISAISPLAQRDQNGQMTGFLAEAELDANGLDAIYAALNDVRLSADMPVSVSLSGRQMTVSEYFIPPLKSFTASAFQD